MDARSIEQWILARRSFSIGGVVIFLVVAGFCLPTFADLTPIVYSQDFNLSLLDPIGPNESAMTEAIIEIPDHFVIADLNVRIDITHTHVFDLQLILQGPTGAWLCLNKYDFKDFFNGENYTNTIFDDGAEISIKDANAPFTGRFKPEPGYMLGIFDGNDVYGTWRLQIYDMWPVHTGTFNHLELIFNAPEPATAILLMFGTCLAVLKRPRGQRTANL